MKAEFKFALRNIKTEQFAIFESIFDESKHVELKGNVNFALNEIDRFIACTTHFEFLIEEKPFMAIQILCEFEIENDSWQPLINKKQTELEIPIEILKHLISLNIGISRGVIHSKTEEMKISFILPLINLDSLLKEPLKHKL
jgi:hypothetical protein